MWHLGHLDPERIPSPKKLNRLTTNVIFGGGRALRGKASFKIQILILIILIIVPIALSVILYYLPLNDVEVNMNGSYRNYDSTYNNSEVVLLVSAANKGSISHYVHLTGTVVFGSEPDTAFTYTYSAIGPIDAGSTSGEVRVRVPVTNELLQDPYEASCSVTLPSAVNQYNMGLIMIASVIWLLGIAAVSTSIVRNRMK